MEINDWTIFWFFNLNIIYSYHTYQNTFYYKYLEDVSKSVNNVNDIIKTIIKIIDENKRR